MKPKSVKSLGASPKVMQVGPEQVPVEIAITPTPVEVIEKPHKKLFWVLLGGCVAFAATIGALTTFHVYILPMIG